MDHRRNDGRYPADVSQLGVVVGGYTISELIGRGGSSSVYQAHQEAFDRDVAIKVLDVDPMSML